MSQENVEIVGRYYDAVDRAFLAYWEYLRSAADGLRAGEISPEAVEMMGCLHPSAEWKTALTGITYRGYGDMASGFDELVDAAGRTASRSRRSLISEATRFLRGWKRR